MFNAANTTINGLLQMTHIEHLKDNSKYRQISKQNFNYTKHRNI